MIFYFYCAIFFPMRIRTVTTLILVIVLGAVFFATGFYFGKSERVVVDPSEKIDFSLFGEVYHLLEENFPGFEEVSEQDLIYGIIRGMIDSLGDPHTTFFDPERSKIFLEDVSGEFEGVGIEIGIRDGKLKVISPLKNTPAYHIGIRSQDVIFSIDEVSTKDMSLEEAVMKIRGPKGELVTLEIERKGEIKEFNIVRDTIKIPSIEWEIVEENIAHIQLFHFHENIEADFASVTREVLNSPAEKVILDLRNNPGGVFNAAISISGRFIESGETVVIQTRGKEGDREKIKTNGAPPVFLDYPLVVLVNEGSASASEILAGALRDQRNTPIIGKTSFGKGSIQRMHTLQDGSIIKITEKYFLTPEGREIDNKGIIPDIEVEITEEDIEKEKDPQLEKAIEELLNKEN